jgi:hypothetical protein
MNNQNVKHAYLNNVVKVLLSEEQLAALPPTFPNKKIVLYTGPQGSGKTHNARRYAAVRGIDYFPAQWNELRFCKDEVLMYIQNSHLFIEGYDPTDIGDNEWLHRLSDIGFRVIVQVDNRYHDWPFWGAPASFLVVRCNYRKEAGHV